MEKIYVLAGKARSGKDSVASIIKKNYKEKDVLIYSCTTYLKKYIMQIYGWNGSEEDKPREILQKLGKEIKEIYPNYFIQRMREDIKFLSGFCDIMIITGVRLEKELDFLKNECGAILIKVKKTADNDLTLEEKNDITETDVDNYNLFDYVINNDGNLEDLENDIKKLLEEI